MQLAVTGWSQQGLKRPQADWGDGVAGTRRAQTGRAAGSRPNRAQLDLAWKLHAVDRFAPFFGWAILLAVSVLPLDVVNSMVHSLAGKQTEVNVAVTASVVWGLASSGIAMNRHRKTKNQGAELERMRGELSRYQGQAGTVHPQ